MRRPETVQLGNSSASGARAHVSHSLGADTPVTESVGGEQLGAVLVDRTRRQVARAELLSPPSANRSVVLVTGVNWSPRSGCLRISHRGGLSQSNEGRAESGQLLSKGSN